MPPSVATRFLGLLLILQLAASGGAAAAGEAALRDAFAATLQEAGVPGGAYAVVGDGRISETVTYGVRRLGEPAVISPDTVFRIASLSKTFAAQLGAMLVSEGKLHWTLPVSDFAPDFRLKRGGQTAALQLQHLLGQSTGVVPNAYDNLLEANVPLARILPQFAVLEPVCPTGRCYTYQNILFSLVQPAYEKATGLSYEALIDDRLLKPLGMTRSSLGRDAYLAEDDRAWPHIRKGGVWRATEVAPGYYQVPPAAGINASVTDMARWLMAQMGSHPEVVTAEQVAELVRPRVATPRELRRRGWNGLLSDAHYGLGWRIYEVGGEVIVMHSGWVSGFVADISYSPRHRTGLVVLLNGESRHINDFTSQFWRRTLAVPAPAAPEKAGGVAP